MEFTTIKSWTNNPPNKYRSTDVFFNWNEWRKEDSRMTPTFLTGAPGQMECHHGGGSEGPGLGEAVGGEGRTGVPFQYVGLALLSLLFFFFFFFKFHKPRPWKAWVSDIASVTWYWLRVGGSFQIVEEKRGCRIVRTRDGLMPLTTLVCAIWNHSLWW